MDTDAYKQLRSTLAKHLKRLKRLNEREAEKDDLVRYLRNRIKPEELFARAYAQYIAVRSASPVLTAQLETVQQLGGIDHSRQWQDADFKEIQTAMDNLIGGMGWNIQ